jgi:hypothetical protein
VNELGPRLAQATVQWALLDGEGVPIYEFNALYTSPIFGRRMRITAIAQNEAPRCQASIERHRIGPVARHEGALAQPLSRHSD